LLKIVGKKDEKAEDAYWDKPNLSNSWLYGGTAYWASTPHADLSSHAWHVGSDGYVSHNLVVIGSYNGVRPIILLEV